MNLHSLSNSSLLEKVKSLSAEERRITIEVLWHLREIERRRLFAELGYNSLFAYATNELKYSEPAAQRRISAMRLLREIPEIEKKVEDGSLTLTVVAQAQSFFKAKKMASGKACTIGEKREVVNCLIGKSKRQSEKLLAGFAPELPKPDQCRALSADKDEITFAADAELTEMLKRIRDLSASQTAGVGYNDLLKFMANIVLDKIDPQRRKSRCQKALSPAKVGAVEQKRAASERNTRYYPAPVKRAVWTGRGGCVFKSALTGRKCGSTFGLEIDHIKPFALGGRSDDPANLRLLCKQHNQLLSARAFGERALTK